MDDAGPVPPEADPAEWPLPVDVAAAADSPGGSDSSRGRVRVVLRVRPLIRREYGYPLAAEKQSHTRHVCPPAACGQSTQDKSLSLIADLNAPGCVSKTGRATSLRAPTWCWTTRRHRRTCVAAEACLTAALTARCFDWPHPVRRSTPTLRMLLTVACRARTGLCSPTARRALARHTPCWGGRPPPRSRGSRPATH